MAGKYVLQRMIPDDRRGLWFDSERFDTEERALAELNYHRVAAQLEINSMGGSGYTGMRVQQMRIIKVM